MNVTERETGLTYNLRFTHGPGTCFVWLDEAGTYFVTAAHLLKGAAAGDIVHFSSRIGWRDIVLREVQFANGGEDIAVFSTDNFRVGVHPEAQLISGYSLALAQDLVFLGFPLGTTNTYPRDGFEAPLVRKASFSGVTVIDGVQVLILDGFNNPGYSGGPVFSEHKGETSLCGVICGYSYDRPNPVYRKSPDGDEERLENAYVKPNSGLIYAHSWEQIGAVLKKLSSRNPSARPDDRPPETPRDERWRVIKPA